MTSSKTSSAMGKLFRPWAAADSSQCSPDSSSVSSTPLTTNTSAFTAVTSEASPVHRENKRTRQKSLDVHSDDSHLSVSSNSQAYLGMALAFSEEMAMFDPASLGVTSGMYPGMCCPVMQCPDLEAALEEYGRLLLQETQHNAKSRKQRPKKFRCPHCQVGFSNNGQLKGHIRIHTGERPYRCDAEHCNKSFTRNEELTRHKRIHSGLRPYPCSACGKRFGRKDHLKKHARTHQVRLQPPTLIPMLPPTPFSPYLYAAAGF